MLKVKVNVFLNFKMYKRIISDIESKNINTYPNNSLSFVSVRIYMLH